MSLARAFTKRVKRTDSTATERSESPLPGRAASMRKDARPINRHEISLPVELLSTTNMLSYNAPDIASYRQTSESSSPSSSASSINSSGSSNKESEHDSSMTDASSVDDSSSPTEPNHLSCYFNAAQSEEKQLRRSRSSGDFTTPKATASVDLSAPVVPTRALSHSKRAHEQVARQRSLRGMASTGSMRSLARSSSHSQRSSKDGAAPTAAERSLSRSRSSAEQRTSIDTFSASKIEKDHPFGKELEQLDEVAEEFGNTVNDAETLEDVKIMAERGLMRFCAQEYLAEITPFADGFGMVSPMHVGMAWI